MLIMSACCCEGSPDCDLWFDTFDGSLVGYDEYAESGDDPGFDAILGVLELTAGTLPTITVSSGALAQPVTLSTGLSGLTVYCETLVGSAAIPELRAEAEAMGCFINHPGHFEPSGGSFVRLMWWPSGSRNDPLRSGWGITRVGIVKLDWPGGQSIVHWGSLPIGATIRLEVHDVSAGAGTYDIHCYVNHVLCHVECDVPLTLTTTDMPVGLVGFGGGYWEYVCIGEDYNSRTRYYTWAPNQYSVIWDASWGDPTPGSPCFDLLNSGADTDEGAGTDMWWLRKLDYTGNPNVCWMDSYARPDSPWDEGTYPDVPKWRLIITLTGTDTYDFRLEWRSADSTAMTPTIVKIVWTLTGQNPYPTGDLILTYDAGESDCTINTELNTITLRLDECASIGDDFANTSCCPTDEIPLTLQATDPGTIGTGVTFTLDGDFEYLPNWPGWQVGALMAFDPPLGGGCPDDISFRLYLRCVGLGQIPDLPTFEGWELMVVNGRSGDVLRTYISPDSMTCDPFSLTFTDIDLPDDDCQSGYIISSLTIFE
jgi:hypothetical protein